MPVSTYAHLLPHTHTRTHTSHIHTRVAPLFLPVAGASAPYKESQDMSLSSHWNGQEVPGLTITCPSLINQLSVSDASTRPSLVRVRRGD